MRLPLTLRHLLSEPEQACCGRIAAGQRFVRLMWEEITMTWHKRTLDVWCKNFRGVETAPGLAAGMSATLTMGTPVPEAPRRRVHITLPAFMYLVATLVMCKPALAQVCKPVSQRTAELGCWIMIDAALGQLPWAPIFWHLDTYSTRAVAEAAKGPRGTVVESLI
jgi:hypothetical protein